MHFPDGEDGMSRYAHPEMLVDTAWVSANLKNPKVRMIEVDVDAIAFEQGHVPGALAWSWTIDLCATVQRDILLLVAGFLFGQIGKVG